MFQSVEIATFAPEDKVKYDFNMTTERDVRNQIRYAEKKGMAEGIEKVAREMLRMGLDVQVIIQATGLTKEQIATL